MTPQKHYGLDVDNYIGTLVQKNNQTTNWVEFFAKERLGHQKTIAVKRGTLRARQVQKLEMFIEKLPDLVPRDPGASLLHGDLWSGNYMVTSDSSPVLVDPAIYCGHREAELAFTTLFGGFPRTFYSAYDRAYPLEAGATDRYEIYNTYPLLVHVNLFGGGYVRQLMSSVEAFL
jgi:fructosamine-3-kinase